MDDKDTETQQTMRELSLPGTLAMQTTWVLQA